MVDSVNNTALFRNNTYGIDKQEYKDLKKELKAEDKKSEDFKLTGKDYREMKKAIKTGDLSTYLDNQSEAIKNAMGLSLTDKVNGFEKLGKATKVEEVKQFTEEISEFLDDDIDQQKLLKYVSTANIARIEKDSKNEFGTNMTELGFKGNVESFVNSDTFNLLNKAFGIA